MRIFNIISKLIRKNPNNIQKTDMTLDELTISQNGLDLIKHYEGVSLNAYLDTANIPTIGVGHIKNVKMGQVITMEQVDEFLKQDLADAESGVKICVKVSLNQAQYDALVSFTFNLGTGNLSNSTLLKLLNEGNYDAVPGQLLRWNRSGGFVTNGLTYRRKSEGVLFSTGKLEYFN